MVYGNLNGEVVSDKFLAIGKEVGISVFRAIQPEGLGFISPSGPESNIAAIEGESFAEAVEGLAFLVWDRVADSGYGCERWRGAERGEVDAALRGGFLIVESQKNHARTRRAGWCGGAKRESFLPLGRIRHHGGGVGDELHRREAALANGIAVEDTGFSDIVLGVVRLKDNHITIRDGG